MTAKFTRRDRVYIALIGIFAALLLVSLLLFPCLKGSLDSDTYTLSELALSRLLGGMIFLFLIPYLGYSLLSFERIPSIKALLAVLPAVVIAVNNFPIIGLIRGSVYVDSGLPKALLLVLACLGIGFFEEVAFRGVIFPLLLTRLLPAMRKRTEAKKPSRLPPETVAVFLAIVLTSAVFGLVHVLNLFAGGSPIAVLMQVGYSFLIGGMCAIVLLKTRCIWFPVFIHALYDLGGMLVQYLGGGKLWDTPTVILTVLVSVAVAIYFLVLLFRMKKDEIEGLLKQNNKKEA
ncbi:MAG: CPBP family intramembrane metalloprotease [Clostridia bacterium]|nr:CPBP family intramembrane metalloprotease [Clostridia bacterium]MBR2908322.1 CPBP family intramembrane metalloprotease [Clostridia bacterium]MBR4034868.1 CPBP family intramembrane metalloprotease [Clostridia bacterium]